MNTLEIKNLSFSYFKNPVLHDLNLQFTQGINVIVGENGGGKTTLFKIIAGIYRPQSGQLLLNGKNMNEYKSIQKHIAYLPQDFQVYPAMKVIDFLKLICKIKEADSSKAYLHKIIEMTDLSDFCYKKMKNLSGGMLKRVGIAQAMIGNPDIIIADEPTAGLDPEQRLVFNRILQNISDETIVLVSTHIIEDIKDFYNRIIIFSDGKSRFSGTYQDLISSVSCVELSSQDLATLKNTATSYRLMGEHTIEGEPRYRIYMDSQIAKERFAKGLKESNLLEIWSYYNDKK